MPDQIEEIKRIDLKDYLQNDFSLVFNSSNQALCPFHKDTYPSFSISKKAGQWLWHCFGCDKGGSIIDFIMEHEHINVSEAIRRLESELPLDLDDPRITKQYNYVDESGNLLYQCVRYDPKSFKYRRPDGNGGWIWDLKNIKRVPYGLDEIINAQFVIIVEGEKDADSVREKLGWVATTNPHGAGNWPEEFGRYLKGKNVIIFPDNDEPGKKHVRSIAESLSGIAASIKIIELPGLREKEDITNWLENGLGGKAQIEDLIKETPQYRKDSSTSTRTFGVESLKEFLNRSIRPRQCLMGSILAKNELTILSGPAKLGKSILALNIALRLASGEPWFTFDVKEACRVLLIQQEVSEEALQERLKKMIGGDIPAVAKPEIKSALEKFYQYSERGLLLDSEDGLKKIYGTIEKVKPDVIIFDPMYTFHSKNENSAEEMGAFFRILHKLIKKYQVAVILIHHFGKPSLFVREGGELHRGSSVIAAASDSNWTFSRVPPNKYSLTSPRPEYGVLSFELRNAAAIEPIILHRDPETLWYELAEMKENKKITAHDIVQALQNSGGELLQSQIIEKFEDKAAPRLIKEAIYEATEKQLIVPEVLKGKGNPKMLRLKDDHDEPQE
jgi:5S rRNA maturation endonuclease (ribonuclease M5)/KaiC/GvpD/RAD55 family RecA-like ATPase